MRMTEKIKEIREKLDKDYKVLQTLDIQPTVNNMERLLQSLYDLKEIYDELGESEDGGSSANSG